MQNVTQDGLRKVSTIFFILQSVFTKTIQSKGRQLYDKSNYSRHSSNRFSNHASGISVRATGQKLQGKETNQSKRDFNDNDYFKPWDSEEKRPLNIGNDRPYSRGMFGIRSRQSNLRTGHTAPVQDELISNGIITENDTPKGASQKIIQGNGSVRKQDRKNVEAIHLNRDIEILNKQQDDNFLLQSQDFGQIQDDLNISSNNDKPEESYIPDQHYQEWVNSLAHSSGKEGNLQSLLQNKGLENIMIKIWQLGVNRSLIKTKNTTQSSQTKDFAPMIKLDEQIYYQLAGAVQLSLLINQEYVFAVKQVRVMAGNMKAYWGFKIKKRGKHVSFEQFQIDVVAMFGPTAFLLDPFMQVFTFTFRIDTCLRRSYSLLKIQVKVPQPMKKQPSTRKFVNHSQYFQACVYRIPSEVEQEVLISGITDYEYKRDIIDLIHHNNEIQQFKDQYVSPKNKDFKGLLGGGFQLASKSSFHSRNVSKNNKELDLFMDQNRYNTMKQEPQHNALVHKTFKTHRYSGQSFKLKKSTPMEPEACRLTSEQFHLPSARIKSKIKHYDFDNAIRVSDYVHFFQGPDSSSVQILESKQVSTIKHKIQSSQDSRQGKHQKFLSEVPQKHLSFNFFNKKRYREFVDKFEEEHYKQDNSNQSKELEIESPIKTEQQSVRKSPIIKVEGAKMSSIKTEKISEQKKSTFRKENTSPESPHHLFSNPILHAKTQGNEIPAHLRSKSAGGYALGSQMAASPAISAAAWSVKKVPKLDQPKDTGMQILKPVSQHSIENSESKSMIISKTRTRNDHYIYTNQIYSNYFPGESQDQEALLKPLPALSLSSDGSTFLGNSKVRYSEGTFKKQFIQDATGQVYTNSTQNGINNIQFISDDLQLVGDKYYFRGPKKRLKTKSIELGNVILQNQALQQINKNRR